MRNKVDGDFLFIDSDTVICQNLTDIENIQYELGAVLVRNSQLSYHVSMSATVERLKKISDISEFYNHPNYFNSGVLFVKDTKSNRDFFEKWNNNYLLSFSKNMPMDQVSLALTNYQLGFPINELDGTWNVQLWSGAKYFNKIKILHYNATASESDVYEPFSSILPLKIKETGCLSENDLSLIAEPLKYLGEATYVISGDNYMIFCSNMGIFLRKLYKHKILFNFIDKIFGLPRIIYNKLFLSSKDNK